MNTPFGMQPQPYSGGQKTRPHVPGLMGFGAMDGGGVDGTPQNVSQILQGLDPRQRSILQAIGMLPGAGSLFGGAGGGGTAPTQTPSPSPGVGGGGGSVPQMPTTQGQPRGLMDAFATGFGQGRNMAGTNGGNWGGAQPRQASPAAQDWFKNWQANAQPGTPPNPADAWFRNWQSRAQPGF